MQLLIIICLASTDILMGSASWDPGRQKKRLTHRDFIGFNGGGGGPSFFGGGPGGGIGRSGGSFPSSSFSMDSGPSSFPSSSGSGSGGGFGGPSNFPMTSIDNPPSSFNPSSGGVGGPGGQYFGGSSPNSGFGNSGGPSSTFNGPSSTFDSSPSFSDPGGGGGGGGLPSSGSDFGPPNDNNGFGDSFSPSRSNNDFSSSPRGGGPPNDFGHNPSHNTNFGPGFTNQHYPGPDNFGSGGQHDPNSNFPSSNNNNNNFGDPVDNNFQQGPNLPNGGPSHNNFLPVHNSPSFHHNNNNIPSSFNQQPPMSSLSLDPSSNNNNNGGQNRQPSRQNRPSPSSRRLPNRRPRPQIHQHLNRNARPRRIERVERIPASPITDSRGPDVDTEILKPVEPVKKAPPTKKPKKTTRKPRRRKTTTTSTTTKKPTVEVKTVPKPKADQKRSARLRDMFRNWRSTQRAKVAEKTKDNRGRRGQASKKAENLESNPTTRKIVTTKQQQKTIKKPPRIIHSSELSDSDEDEDEDEDTRNTDDPNKQFYRYDTLWEPWRESEKTSPERAHNFDDDYYVYDEYDIERPEPMERISRPGVPLSPVEAKRAFTSKSTTDATPSTTSTPSTPSQPTTPRSVTKWNRRGTVSSSSLPKVAPQIDVNAFMSKLFQYAAPNGGGRSFSPTRTGDRDRDKVSSFLSNISNGINLLHSEDSLASVLNVLINPDQLSEIIQHSMVQQPKGRTVPGGVQTALPVNDRRRISTKTSKQSDKQENMVRKPIISFNHDDLRRPRIHDQQRHHHHQESEERLKQMITAPDALIEKVDHRNGQNPPYEDEGFILFGNNNDDGPDEITRNDHAQRTIEAKKKDPFYAIYYDD